MIQSPIGLLLVLIFFVPGFFFEYLRARKKPYKQYSLAFEAGKIFLISLSISSFVFFIWSKVNTRLSDVGVLKKLDWKYIATSPSKAFIDNAPNILTHAVFVLMISLFISWLCVLFFTRKFKGNIDTVPILYSHIISDSEGDGHPIVRIETNEGNLVYGAISSIDMQLDNDISFLALEQFQVDYRGTMSKRDDINTFIMPLAGIRNIVVNNSEIKKHIYRRNRIIDRIISLLQSMKKSQINIDPTIK